MVKWFDNLPLFVKVIFALPCLDIVWVIYRIAKSAKRNNLFGIILGIILIIIHWFWLSILDIISLILFGKVLWID